MRAKAGYGLETITTATAMALAKNKSHPKPSQARPRLDWSTKTTCRETAAQRETLSSRRAICKFDDSFNKNKGKGTEIKHNNV